MPFALRAGAEFFLPVTAALVVAIALVPMLEWFERRGVPSKFAAFLCVVIFLLLTIFAIASIVLPAIDWVALVPERIGKVRAALEPVIDLYKNFERFIDRTLSRGRRRRSTRRARCASKRPIRCSACSPPRRRTR